MIGEKICARRPSEISALLVDVERGRRTKSASSGQESVFTTLYAYPSPVTFTIARAGSRAACKTIFEAKAVFAGCKAGGQQAEKSEQAAREANALL